MAIGYRREVLPDDEQKHNTFKLQAAGDLESRIKSLLKSHNKRRPTQTPCPSPELKYSSVPNKASDRSYLAPPQAHTSAIQEIAPVSRHPQPLQLNMVAIRLDSSVSRVTDDFKASLRELRQSSMRAERAFSVDGSWASAESELGQRAINEIHGGESRAPDGLRGDSFTFPTFLSRGRPPRYDLRVLPPRHLRVNPNALQIPGSYNSDTSRIEHALLERNLKHHQDDHQWHDHEALDLHDHLGTMVEPSANAVTAIGELKKFNFNPLKVLNKATHNYNTENCADQAESEPPRSVPSRSSSLPTAQADTIETSESQSAYIPSQAQASTAQLQKDEPARLSPTSRALSALSELSSRSGLRRGSSISVTTNQSRGSVVRPSEIQYVTVPSSTVSPIHSENRENKEQQCPAQQLWGKPTATIGSSSSLTTRPNHRQSHAIREGDQLRSLTVPSSSASELNYNKPGTEDMELKQQQQSNDQSISKAIGDLENLLEEALSIAGKAASKETSEADLDLAQGERHKQTEKEDVQPKSTKFDFDSASDSSDSDAIDEEDHPTLSTGGHVTIINPAADFRYKNQFKRKRDATPYPARSVAATRHQSAVPPVDHSFFEENKEIKKTSHVRTSNGKDAYDHASPFENDHLKPVQSQDWVYVRDPNAVPLPLPHEPPVIQASLKEESRLLAHKEGMRAQQRPPLIQPRTSSKRLQGRRVPTREELNLPNNIVSSGGSESDELPYIADYKTSALQYHPVIREAMSGGGEKGARSYALRPREDTLRSLRDKEILIHSTAQQKQNSNRNDYDLKDRHHFSIRESKGFSLSRSHRRKPIARDWSTGRKRLVATVTCITTALMGLVLGIYAGEVPALQYALADEHHYTILGNVVFFLGLAVTTSLLWPLPLLHGRKPYTLAALTVLLPLQFPQGLTVSSSRSPYVPSYKVGVLLPRAFSGLIMGLANINFMTTLLDLFGASLQSGNPHQEYVNKNDVRRHGGGIGAWLGIWTWCSVMSIGVGFLIGAGIISGLNVSWGFWTTIILNVAVLLLNVIVPEVRRSPYRRSMAEVRSGTDISRRVARGEIKMHLESTGPKHWHEEVLAGYTLAFRMLKQPGFFILALYQGWIYGQIVMIIVVCSNFLTLQEI